MSRPPGRLPYRPDIDGLRAIAVVLVVAYHFGVPGFSGGFIGVDLFFVISGFLIASIFERQPRIGGSMLAAFYGRRIQRLMPAFLFVAAVTIAAASVLLLPDNYEALLTSVRESLVGRANVYFARETTGYFASNAMQLPWLHTWSLSIEWQFYLCFPLLVFALRRLPSPRARTTVVAAIVVVGIAWSVHAVTGDPAQAYFSTTARFFEFLIGALAASVVLPTALERHARHLATAALIALLVIANRYTAATSFPGVAALAVCAIGFVLLMSGAVSPILTNARVVALGKRSYSIYLWHWPVIALLDYVQHRPAAPEIAAWFAAILLAADATWRWVEVPGIAMKWRPAKAFVVGCVLPLALVAVATVFVRNHDGLPQRLGEEARHAEANIRRHATHAFDGCHDRRIADIEACASGDVGASGDPGGHSDAAPVLLIGDSHARHFRPFVQVLATGAHLRLYGLTDSECLTLEGTGMSPNPSLDAACVEAIARDYALIRSRRFRYVVLAERWIGYPPDALRGLDASLATIVEAGAIPVVFLPVAEDGTDKKDCFYRHIKLRVPYANDCAIRQDNDFASQAKARVIALIDDMRRQHPSLVVIDPQAVQCRDDACATVIDRTPIYTDPHHLAAFGSVQLADLYLARFGNPLGSPLEFRSPP